MDIASPLRKTQKGCFLQLEERVTKRRHEITNLKALLLLSRGADEGNASRHESLDIGKTRPPLAKLTVDREGLENLLEGGIYTR